MLRVNNKLWIWSDNHFGHNNIIKYCQRPINHELIMLSEWVRSVHPEDQILNLGDIFMGSGGNSKRWADIVKLMPGEKFTLMGNHDRDESLIRRAGFEILEPFVHKGVAFSHRPVCDDFPIEGAWDVNVHGHTHNNPWPDSHHADEGTPYHDKTYINVSVEMLDLKPRRLGSIINMKGRQDVS